MRKYRSSSNLEMVWWFLANGYIKGMRRSNLNLVMVQWFLAELFPFHFENNMKFSVSIYYLPNSITHSTQIWHMDMAKECAGQARIWSWFDDFWQSYAPFTLKMIWSFQFPFIISPTVLHIQLKFDIWIWQRNAQVKLEFGHGLMIFGRVMPLSLWKWYELFSFRSLSPQQYFTIKSNLTYRYIIGISSSSSNLAMVWWFLAELRPFHFEKKPNFSVLVHYLPNSCTYLTQI
jgi:hypothetical protein